MTRSDSGYGKVVFGYVVLAAVLLAFGWFAAMRMGKFRTEGWPAEPLADELAPDVSADARIPVSVDWADHELAAASVTFGVPFPRGQIQQADQLRLVDGQGRLVPADFGITATWDGPDGTARWVQVNAEVRRDRTYVLEAGGDIRHRASGGLAIRERPDVIEVDTGPMRIQFDRQVATLVRSVSLVADRGEMVSAAQTRDELPRLIDAQGRVYRAGGADKGLHVDVVEAGPHRAAIRREGWYVDGQGERFCGFVTYTYLFAGETGFRHDHTLIVAFDSNEHQIRDIQLPLPLNLGSGIRARFAGSDRREDAIERAVYDRPLRLTQMAHDRWELAEGAETIAEGERTGGWFGVRDGVRGAVAGVYEAWQQYPVQFRADGHVLRVHLWSPEKTDPLDLRPSAQMGDLYPGNQVFHSRWYRAGLDEMTQAYGLAKTHSVRVEFHPAGGEEEAWQRVRAHAVRPVFAFADPEWVCASGAVGRIHHRDRDRFPEIEALLDAVIYRKLWLRERYAQYGWVDYGDVFYRVPPSLWRRWASMFYAFPSVAPRLFVRSGDRDAWAFHRANARHIMDIDIGHLDSREFRKTRGLRYGGDGGIAHYAAEQYGVGCDTHIDFMFMDYYLNGNLRAMEVAESYARAYAARRDRPVTHYDCRHTGGALRLFSEAYQATWDPEYLDIMRQVADVIYAEHERAGVTRHDDIYMTRGKLLYYELTGDTRMRDLFLDNMARNNRERNFYAMAGDGRTTSIEGLSHAWFLTGDDVYLPFMLWQLDTALERVAVSGEPEEIGAAPWTFEHAYMSTHGWQLPVAMAVLAAAEHLPEADALPAPDLVEQTFNIWTNGPIYLLHDGRMPASVSVQVQMYRRFTTARDVRTGNFSNWTEWTSRLEGWDTPALRVFDPDGREIRRVALDRERLMQDVEIDWPAESSPGTYVVVPHSPAAPMLARLTASSMDRRVVQAGETSVRGPRNLFFRVPAGTGSFRVRIRDDILRGQNGFAIRAANGEIVAEEQWSGHSAQWRTAELDAGSPGADQVYQIGFFGSARPMRFIQLDGVPGFLASTPDELYTPPRALQAPPVRVPDDPSRRATVEAGLPWGGRAEYLPAGASAELSAPAGGRPLMNPQRGTLELWVRPADDPTRAVDRHLVQCGEFRLYRRTNIGMYFMIGSQRQLRDFVLPSDRWTHLAVTWRRLDDRQVEMSLFADGVRVGVPGVFTADNDWTGNRLSIPRGPDGIFVAGLRISDGVRYTENFPRPRTVPVRDPHTLLLEWVDHAP